MMVLLVVCIFKPKNHAEGVALGDLLRRFDRVVGRVGQNRIYTSYMTVYLVIPLPKTPYTVPFLTHPG
jgi:hypothetical protein